VLSPQLDGTEMKEESPMTRRLSAVLALTLVMTAAFATPAAAAPPFPDQIDLPNGWAPEGITAGPGTTVYVGSLVDGAIWQADVRTGDGFVLVSGIAGKVAVGVDYEADANRLWVAGGPTGEVRVYDASSGDLLETYTFAPVGFLNDLVVTDDAVYVTDSGIQQLDVIPLGPEDALPDPADVTTLPLTGDISFVPNEFNANGIVEARSWLIVVQSNTGQLFRVDPATGETTEIDLGEGVTVANGDGLEVHGGTLYVVRNFNNLVAVFKLGPGLESAALLGELTSSGLDIPTTAAYVAGSLYAVNARFSTPVTPDTAYWITRLAAMP
jgi:sugar lactone lactonase YvrE